MDPIYRNQRQAFRREAISQLMAKKKWKPGHPNKPGNPPTLNALQLSNSTLAESSEQGTIVGWLSAFSQGSSVSLIGNSGGRFQLSGTTIEAGPTATDYEAATSHEIIVRETLRDATNSPRDTVFSISIADMVDGPALQRLTGTFVLSEAASEGAPAGIIAGVTEGSALSVVNDAGGRVRLTGVAVLAGATPLDFEMAASHEFTIRETLAGSVNSPRDTVLTLAVADVDDGPVLAPLTGNFELPEDAAAGHLAGQILGKTEGSSIELLDDAGGRIRLDASGVRRGATALDYEDTASHSFIVRESLAGSPNSPRDTVFALTVTDVSDGPALAALTGSFSLSESAPQGAIAGEITGMNTGSTLTLVDDAGMIVDINGTNVVRGAAPLDFETNASHYFTIRETLSGALNSPRDTVLTLAVIDVADGPLLAPLFGQFTLAEDASAGDHAGDLAQTTNGSTIELVDDAGGRVRINGLRIERGPTALDFENASDYSFTIRETLAGSPNSPRNTVLTLNVTDVADGPSLVALTLSASQLEEGVPEATVVADLQGVTAGSTLALLDNAGGRFQLVDGVIQAGPTTTDYAANTLHDIIIREMLAGSPNSPRETTLTIFITDVPDTDVSTPTITSADKISIEENADLSHILTANRPVTWERVTKQLDSNDFEIVNPNKLRWADNQPKDFENPEDGSTGSDNIYQVKVRATDAAGKSTEQVISVTLIDVDENQVIPDPSDVRARQEYYLSFGSSAEEIYAALPAIRDAMGTVDSSADGFDFSGPIQDQHYASLRDSLFSSDERLNVRNTSLILAAAEGVSGANWAQIRGGTEHEFLGNMVFVPHADTDPALGGPGLASMGYLVRTISPVDVSDVYLGGNLAIWGGEYLLNFGRDQDASSGPVKLSEFTYAYNTSGTGEFRFANKAFSEVYPGSLNDGNDPEWYLENIAFVGNSDLQGNPWLYSHDPARPAEDVTGIWAWNPQALSAKTRSLWIVLGILDAQGQPAIAVRSQIEVEEPEIETPTTPPLEPGQKPVPQAVRYMAPTAQGIGNGLSFADAMALSSGNVADMLAATGPGTEIRLRNDLGDYTTRLRADEGWAGTAEHRNYFLGVDANDEVGIARFVSDRTSPWPDLRDDPYDTTHARDGGTWSSNKAFKAGQYFARDNKLWLVNNDFTSGSSFDSASADITKIGDNGNRNPLIEMEAGADHFGFLAIEWADCAFGVRWDGSCRGNFVGPFWLRDTEVEQAVVTWRENYSRWDRHMPAAVQDAATINTAAVAKQTAELQTELDRWGCRFINVQAGLDVGMSKTAASDIAIDDFVVVGVKGRGVARRIWRWRGPGTGFRAHYCETDAEQQRQADGAFAVLYEGNLDASDAIINCVGGHNIYGMNGSTGSFKNGDIFTADRGNSNFSFVGIWGYDSIDGVWDTKGVDFVVFGQDPSHGPLRNTRRGYRAWGQTDLYGVDIGAMRSTPGGSRHAVFSSGSDMIRVHSGTIDTSADDIVPFLAVQKALIGISTAVTVTKHSGSSLTQQEDGAGIAFFDPTDRTPAVISSVGARTIDEGSADTYLPSTDKPGRWFLNGGPDAQHVSVADRYLAPFVLTPQISGGNDANGDDTFEYQGLFRTLTGATSTHDVAVTVSEVIETTTILNRMADLGERPSSSREAVYQKFIDALSATTLLTKSEIIIVGGHGASSAAQNWAREPEPVGGINQRLNGSPLPDFVPDVGWVASTAQWAFVGDNMTQLNRGLPTSFSMAVLTKGTPTGPICGIDYAGIASNSSGEATIWPYSSTSQKLPGTPFADAETMVGWSRDGDAWAAYVDGAEVAAGTSSSKDASNARMRFGVKDGSSGSAGAPIFFFWAGLALTQAEHADLTDAVGTLMKDIDALGESSA